MRSHLFHAENQLCKVSKAFYTIFLALPHRFLIARAQWYKFRFFGAKIHAQTRSKIEYLNFESFEFLNTLNFDSMSTVIQILKKLCENSCTKNMNPGSKYLKNIEKLGFEKFWFLKDFDLFVSLCVARQFDLSLYLIDLSTRAKKNCSNFSFFQT